MDTCGMRSSCVRLSSLLDRQFDDPAIYAALASGMCKACQREQNLKRIVPKVRPEEVAVVY